RCCFAWSYSRAAKREARRRSVFKSRVRYAAKPRLASKRGLARTRQWKNKLAFGRTLIARVIFLCSICGSTNGFSFSLLLLALLFLWPAVVRLSLLFASPQVSVL